MMLARLSKHSLYYFSLIVILFLGFILVSGTSNRSFQIGVVLITTFFYVLWGLMHHLLNHDFTLKIMIEYILIGVFGLTVIFFLLTVNGNY